jgi:hypothetical protein
MKKQEKFGKTRIAGRADRVGLSTLEMVLCLPILLMVMALMVNLGTVATWKVRGLTVARHAMWSHTWPRTGASNPRVPDWYWPPRAGISQGAAGNVAELDDPRLQHPVVRGPLPFGIQVNADLLDPSRGLRSGSAEMQRGFPMLGTLGEYHLEAHCWLLDDKWQYQRTGLSRNRQRRIPVLYALAKAPASLSSAYLQTVTAIIQAPFRADLKPLDDDDEFRYWHGSSPDFHPSLRRFCSLDRDTVERPVSELIDRIQGKSERRHRVPSVAERMAQAFISLYQSVIVMLQDAAADGPLSPAAQAQIAQLQQKIDVLQDFLQSLR